MFYRDSALGRYMPVPFDLSKPEMLTPMPAPGMYKIEFNLVDGFYLSDTKLPEPPKRLYGKVLRNAELVWTNFERLGRSAALFSGLKGTGKSLTTMHIAGMAIERAVPVVILDQPYHGPAFSKFMAKLNRVVVIIDEFEKVYRNNDNDNDQEKILSMLDGVGAMGDKLYLLTINDTWALNKNLINRPGRIRYHFRFGPLSPAEVTEYCEVNLERTSLIPYLATLAKHTVAFSYDLLSKLVDELNHREDLTVDDVIEVFNVESETTLVSYELQSFSVEGTEKKLKVDTTLLTVDISKPKANPVVSKVNRKNRYDSCASHLEDTTLELSPDFSTLTVTGDYLVDDEQVKVTIVYKTADSTPRKSLWSRRSLVNPEDIDY